MLESYPGGIKHIECPLTPDKASFDEKLNTGLVSWFHSLSGIISPPTASFTVIVGLEGLVASLSIYLAKLVLEYAVPPS